MALNQIGNDCDALTEEDWKTLATMAVTLLPPFGAVEGVPRGGLKFAEALKQYITSGPLLIAEDVITTGASIEKFRNGREAIGIVVFQRQSLPSWITSIFQTSVKSDRSL